MLYIVLFGVLVLVISVIYMIVKIMQSSSPKGFARGIARAQLWSLNAMKASFPEMERESLYRSAIGCRPGYSAQKVESIINGAKEACEETGVRFNFQAVVAALVATEF